MYFESCLEDKPQCNLTKTYFVAINQKQMAKQTRLTLDPVRLKLDSSAYHSKQPCKDLRSQEQFP